MIIKRWVRQSGLHGHRCGGREDGRPGVAVRHGRGRVLTDTTRLADDLDRDEVRDLSAKLDRDAIDLDVSDREALAGGNLVNRADGVCRVAPHDLPIVLRVGIVRRLPAARRQILDVERHRIRNADIGLLASQLIHLRTDVWIAIAVRGAVLAALDEIIFSGQDDMIDLANDRGPDGDVDLGTERVGSLNQMHCSARRGFIPLVLRTV